MKTSLLSMSVAALLASNSMTVLASNVTIPNTFTSGTPAVAAQVNANFSAVATSVNDNNTRLTTTESAVATNATNIQANTDAIAALGGAGACSSDMVAVGSLCVDIYEASLYDAPTGGNPVAASVCLPDGSDCGKNAANAIYAQSIVGVLPSASISWYQAAQACANVGKRLPTTAEWQMAASGTPGGAFVSQVDSCNVTGSPGLAVTGASAAGATPCVSSAGAFDMVGNLWEWTAELTGLATGAGFTFSTTNDADGRIMGAAYNSGATNTTAVGTVGAGPTALSAQVGFRCVR